MHDDGGDWYILVMLVLCFVVVVAVILVLCSLGLRRKRRIPRGDIAKERMIRVTSECETSFIIKSRMATSTKREKLRAHHFNVQLPEKVTGTF